MSDIQTAEQPPVLDAAPSDDGARRRQLLIGGAVAVALLLVLGVAYLLFFSGGGGSPDSLGTVPVPPSGGGASTTAKATPAPTYNGKLGRNPFLPLAAEATPVTAPSSAAPTTGATSAAPTTPAPTHSAVNAYLVKVRWVNAAGTTATVVVNGTVYRNVHKADTLPKGATVQLQVVDISRTPGLGVVQFQLGSGSVTTVGVGEVQTFRYSG